MYSGVLQVLDSGTCAKEYEYDGIDDDSAEHKDEDPEVVEPESLALVGSVDPTPSTGSHIEITTMFNWTN